MKGSSFVLTPLWSPPLGSGLPWALKCSIISWFTLAQNWERKEKNLAPHGFQNTLKKKRTSLASPKANCQRATLFAPLKYPEKRIHFLPSLKYTEKKTSFFCSHEYPLSSPFRFLSSCREAIAFYFVFPNPILVSWPSFGNFGCVFRLGFSSFFCFWVFIETALVVRRRSGAGLLKRRFFLFSCMRISSVQKFWGLCSFGMLWGCFCC